MPISAGTSVDEARDILRRALAYANRTGSVTYDPDDFKGQAVVRWTHRRSSRARSALRLALYAGAFVFPRATRRLLGVRPQRSAGSSAFHAMALCATASLDGDPALLERARGHLEWLAMHPAAKEPGEAWGLPFHWQAAFGFVPANTPTGHTTMCCASAFLDYYDLTADGWALEHVVAACRFFFHGLHATPRPRGAVSLSYTPLDRAAVLNTDAAIAGVLLRAARRTGATELGELGARLVRHVVDNQNADGGWYYWSVAYRGEPSIVDGLHTGMLVAALIDAYENIDDGPERVRCLDAASRGARFYARRLFDADGTPRFATDRRYPVDAYSCGQGLITLAKMAGCPALDEDVRGEAAALASRVVQRTRRLLMRESGAFDYRRYRLGSIRLHSLRWAQAVICLGLARYCALFVSARNGVRLGA
jgi:hypothetical protein